MKSYLPTLTFNWKGFKRSISFIWLLIFYMACVQAYNIRLLVGSGLQTLHPLVYIARCSGKTYTRKIMKEYVMSCLNLFIKYSLENKHHCFLLKGRKLCRTLVIGTWLPMEFMLELQENPKLHIGYLILY